MEVSNIIDKVSNHLRLFLRNICMKNLDSVWTLNQAWIKDTWKKKTKNRELRPWIDQIAQDLSNVKINN